MPKSSTQSILDKYGAQKDSKAIHKTHSPIKAAIHQISRAVMRNPKLEMRRELNKIHQMFKDEFAKSSDAEIAWLLQAAPAARGGFKDPSSFREFLLTPPESITSSRLIMAIDSISTAIGFGALGLPNPPAEAHAAYNLYLKLHTKFVPGFIPCLEINAYNTRDIDSYSVQEEEKYVQGIPDDVSEASDVDYLEEMLPKKQLREFKYREAIDPTSGKYSWPAAAVRGNIPIRAHVSGTAPIVLAVINKLYEDKNDPWLQNDKNVRCFAGAVLIPSYERGDFHSTAETTAALEYFLAFKKGQPESVKTPKECLQMGLDCMASATDGELELAIKERTEELLSIVTNENCMLRIGPDEMLELLKNCKNTVLLIHIIASQFSTQNINIETLFQWVDDCADEKAAEMIIQYTLFRLSRLGKFTDKSDIFWAGLNKMAQIAPYALLPLFKQMSESEEKEKLLATIIDICLQQNSDGSTDLHCMAQSAPGALLLLFEQINCSNNKDAYFKKIIPILAQKDKTGLSTLELMKMAPDKWSDILQQLHDYMKENKSETSTPRGGFFTTMQRDFSSVSPPPLPSSLPPPPPLPSSVPPALLKLAVYDKNENFINFIFIKYPDGSIVVEEQQLREPPNLNQVYFLQHAEGELRPCVIQLTENKGTPEVWLYELNEGSERISFPLRVRRLDFSEQTDTLLGYLNNTTIAHYGIQWILPALSSAKEEQVSIAAQPTTLHVRKLGLIRT